ncbi:MAG: cardiolipin synthase [Pseudomonadales bacterium]
MDWIQWSIVLLGGILSLLGSINALLNKRDPRSALAWIAICFALPFLGVLLYYMLGKNRIQTRAKRLLPRETQISVPETKLAPAKINSNFTNLARLAAAVSRRSLMTGNMVQPLFNGEQSYPAMLAAIRAAKKYIYLTTYIFGTGKLGREFVAELGKAVQRGVVVKVLIDGFGVKYSFPRASYLLRKAGVQVALYLPPTLIPPNLTINLRNHRKLLLVDGRIGFTGGMNIRSNHLLRHARGGVKDVHFQLCGPILQQMESVFISDWIFTTREGIEIHDSPTPVCNDNMSCRVLLEGPNEDMDNLIWVLVGAISSAAHSIRLITPYFLPSRELEVALQTAALRGVDVNVVLPGKNNLPFMKWACNHILSDLLRAGVKVHYSPGPFAHTKLFVVDEYYTQLGSSNMDPRSLRLNFELVVEVYDQHLGKQMAAYIDHERDQAVPVTVQQLQERWFITRIRDAFFWLFSPYL